MSFEPAAYARAIESFLCQKNDGHLIRIVGPAFEKVVSWAERGIPLKVALAGVDRYFARYYRKGPRRRPVRVEFCEADVLDAFDEWRRAVGVSLVVADADGGPVVEEPIPAAPRPRRSLRTHIESVLSRLTVLRGSDKLGGGPADQALADAVRALEPLVQPAEHARGDERQRILDTLAVVDRRLLDALELDLPGDVRRELGAEAARELEPFRGRLTPEAYAQARRAVVARLVREQSGVPEIRA
jgi:hypothetical protein